MRPQVELWPYKHVLFAASNTADARVQARGVAEGIMATVELMAASGLPCFGRGRPVENLRRRFRLDLRDAEAAAFMQGCVRAAYDRWTTGFYDVVQYLQNNIPK